MIHGKWIRTIAFTAALASLSIQGCRKENGIDNNNVIRTPYSLFISDNEGVLWKTNDGTLVKKLFRSDAYEMKSIAVSGDKNILFVKKNLHGSFNDGTDFNNLPNELVNPAAATQSLMLDVPSQNRIYYAGFSLTDMGYGIRYSEDHGKTWKKDEGWKDLDIEPTPIQPLAALSFTQLKRGDLFYVSVIDGSSLNPKIYKRTGASEKWETIPQSGLTTHYYFLSHLNDLLLATDTSGQDGVRYSDNGGVTWSPYSGLPANTHLHCTVAPFDQTVLVGTHGKGIYRLQSGSFVPSNNGLEANTIVYSIAAKSDTYKNTNVKNYVYAGTSTGLYRSEDLGQNWIKTFDGDFRCIY